MMRNGKVFGCMIIFSAVLLLVSAAPVRADLINGSIGFSGAWTPLLAANGAATTIDLAKYVQIDTALVIKASGDLNVIPIATNAKSSPNTYNSFSINPISVPIDPLWKIVVGSQEFTFRLDSLVINTQTVDFLNLSGTGTMKGTNFDDTKGVWTFSASRAGGSFTWSDIAAVPEPSSLILLGAALMGVAAFRKVKAS